MAEVLAIAGGIASFAQILATAVKACEKITQFCQDFQDAPMELLRIRDKMCILKASLLEIQRFLFAFPDDVLLPPDLRKVLVNVFDFVQVNVVALDQVSRLQAGCSSRSVGKRLRWAVLDRSRAEKLLRNLKDSESTLSVVIGLLNL